MGNVGLVSRRVPDAGVDKEAQGWLGLDRRAVKGWPAGLRRGSAFDRSSSQRSFILGLDSLANQQILVPGNVRSTRSSQADDPGWVGPAAWFSQIAGDQPAHVFGQGDAELGGSLARAALELGVEHDLGAYHHDGAIRPSCGSRPASNR
jgi:hypothetical protein